MSCFRSTSILFTLLTLPLLLQAMPMSPPQAVRRELPQASADLKADVDATICRINGVNIPNPALILEQLEHGNESVLEAIGIDTRSHDLVDSIRSLLQQCASDPSTAVQLPLSSVATPLAAPVNDIAMGSINDLIVGNPLRDGSTPQGDSADTNAGAQDDNSHGTDDSDDGPAEMDNGSDTAEDESREDGSDDAEPETDAQDDDSAQDASRMSDSNEPEDASFEHQDTDNTSEDSDPTVDAGDQSPSAEDSAPTDSSDAEESPSSTDEQRVGAPGGEGCSSQGSSSSRYEGSICVDGQMEM